MKKWDFFSLSLERLVNDYFPMTLIYKARWQTEWWEKDDKEEQYHFAF